MRPATLDRRLLLALRTRGHTPAREQAVRAFSRLGEHGAVWLAVGLAGGRFDPDPARRPRWRRGARLTAVSYAVNQVVKFVVRRHRPALPRLISTGSDLSFPSAHATTAFAAARAYRGLLPASLRYGGALGLALSRPYLGVHYPSDILAGAALGTVVGAWR